MKNKENIYQDIRNRAESIYERYQSTIEQNRKEGCDYSRTKLHFSIFESMKLGGQSSFQNNIDNIRISSGTIDNFYDYFYEFAKYNTKNLLRIMGLQNDDDENSFEGIGYNEKGEIRSVDSLLFEEDLTVILDIFVSRFILTHEFGHLFNGHCSYLNSIGNGKVQFMPIFNYSSVEQLEYISALDYRTLEYDADAFATTENLKYLIILYTQFEEKVDNSFLHIKAIDLFYWWGFAIRSMFLLMQQLLQDEKSLSERRYFPSIMRWGSVIFIVDKLINPQSLKIKFRGGDTADKILQKIVDGSIYAEKYFNEKNNDTKNWYVEIQENSEYLKLINEANENWRENMVKKLMPFSRLSLYKAESDIFVTDNHCDKC